MAGLPRESPIFSRAQARKSFCWKVQIKIAFHDLLLKYDLYDSEIYCGSRCTLAIVYINRDNIWNID